MAKPQKISPVASFVHSLRLCLVLVEWGGEERSQKNYEYEDVFFLSHCIVNLYCSYFYIKMFVISKKCRTLKPQKAKLHYFPYKTSKLKVFLDGGLQLNSIAKLLLEVYAWPKLKMFRLGGLHALASLVRNRISCTTWLYKMSLGWWQTWVTR